MKAFKISLKNRQSYIVGQKTGCSVNELIDRNALEALVKVGNDRFRVKDIAQTAMIDIDRSSAPQSVLEEDAELATRALNAPNTFTKLPTTNVVLVEGENGLKMANMSRQAIENEQRPYFQATVHYRIGQNGEKEFLLDRNSIRHLVKVVFKDGYAVVSASWSYGRQINA